ncbi:unnamed protein product, partial [Scytosiphon promiscuus]
PNIVLILTDDQGYGDLKFHKNDSVDTPVLDKLASESLRLDRFYVSPVCAPTRASLLTGRYHLRTGVSWVTRGAENMRENEVTMAEVFKGAGYATGCFGKWHNGAHYPNSPQGQGFDEFTGFTAGHLNNYFDSNIEKNGEDFTASGYITDFLANEAMGFMEKNKDKPFFCYIPFNAPHTPYQGHANYYDNYYNKLGIEDDKT